MEKMPHTSKGDEKQANEEILGSVDYTIEPKTDRQVFEESIAKAKKLEEQLNAEKTRQDFLVEEAHGEALQMDKERDAQRLAALRAEMDILNKDSGNTLETARKFGIETFNRAEASDALRQLGAEKEAEIRRLENAGKPPKPKREVSQTAVANAETTPEQPAQTVSEILPALEWQLEPMEPEATATAEQEPVAPPPTFEKSAGRMAFEKTEEELEEANAIIENAPHGVFGAQRGMNVPSDPADIAGAHFNRMAIKQEQARLIKQAHEEALQMDAERDGRTYVAPEAVARKQAPAEETPSAADDSEEDSTEESPASHEGPWGPDELIEAYNARQEEKVRAEAARQEQLMNQAHGEALQMDRDRDRYLAEENARAKAKWAKRNGGGFFARLFRGLFGG